jgi:hypothetical protein
MEFTGHCLMKTFLLMAYWGFFIRHPRKNKSHSGQFNLDWPTACFTRYQPSGYCRRYLSIPKLFPVGGDFSFRHKTIF